jgi:hypothetical protein
VKFNLNPDGAASIDPNRRLSLFPETTLGNTPEYQEDLAAKYSISMGADSPGTDAMLASLREGNTSRYSELLSMRKGVELQNARNAVVQQIADSGNQTAFDTEVVRGMSEADLSSPNLNSILEEEYARKIVELQASLVDDDNESMVDSIDANIDDTYEAIDRTQWQAARNFIASTILDGLKSKFNDTGLIEKGVAFAQQFVPFRSWASINTYNPSETSNAFFPGDSLEKKFAYISTLPPSEAKTVIENYVKRELETNNYFDAMTFVEGYLSYSETDKNWNNLWAGLDLAGVVPLGLFTKGIKGAAKAATVPLKDMERMAVSAGLPTEAAKASFTKSLMDGKLPSHDIKNLGDAEKLTLSLSRPQELFNGGTLRAPGAQLAKLEQAAVARAGAAMRILTEVERVERNMVGEIAKGFEETQEFLVKNFVHANHGIVDVKKNLAEESIGNVYSVTLQIGRNDGSAFLNEKAALKASKLIGLKTNDYKVVELPNGSWVVEVSRYVDETSLGIRNVKIDTDNKLPDNVVTRFLGKFVGADNLLSKAQTTARGAAVHSSEHMGYFLEEFAKPFTNMNKKQREDFENFLIGDRDFVKPSGTPGVNRKTVFEFEDAFYTRHNKLPTYDQIDAYTAFRQLYDLDYIVRDLDVLKQEAIMGLENFSFVVKGEGDAKATKALKGKEVTDLPRGSKTPFRIAVIDDEGNVATGNSYNTRYMNTKDWERLDGLKKDGYRIIQAFEGSTKIGDNYHSFVMVRNFKRDQPGLGNLKYEEGSRMVDKHPWYGKQARVNVDNGAAYYRGDKSLFNARSFDEAKEIAEKINVARLMVKNRSKGVKKYFEENLPLWTLKRFMQEVKKGNISLDVPVMVTKSGSRTIDSGKVMDDLRAEGANINAFYTENEFDLSNRITGKFLGERRDRNMKTYGTEKGTIFELQTDPFMSPLDTVRYSMSNMVDTHVIHDYRLKSVRDFTKQYADELDGTRADFDTNGMQYIFEPKYRTGADPNKVKSAESQRQAILSLFNNKTFVEKQVDMYKERVVRSVRKLVGDGPANWVEDKALPFASDGDTTMKAFAFHTKLGMFNPKQLFLQASSAVNILAIAPTHGARGAAAAWPLIMAMNSNRKFVRSVGEKLKGLTTFSPDEYEELVDAYRNSGFYHVGGDVAYLDNLKPPSLVKGKIRKILDAGTVPFKTGESIARTMAYATAYSERKKALKGAMLGRSDRAWVLQRAKDLTGNMTRDSNAAYQKGYGAVATQFFGYQMRLMEQMLGSKLTLAEKGRLFTGMSLMYGVPVAGAMLTGVIPIREWMKDWMAKEGIEYDNTLAEPFIDGFASNLLEAATGMDLNVAERYGPGGLTTFYDLLKGDAELTEILMGASGGVIGDTLMDAGGAIPFIWDAVGLRPGAFQPALREVMDVFTNVSTVNSSEVLWKAINTGKWISQNENALTDISATEAVTAWFVGLQPERVSNAFNQIDAISSQRDMQNKVMKELVTEYRRGLQLLKDGFHSEAKVYFNRVLSRGYIEAGLTVKQMVTVWNRAIDGRPLDDTVIQQYEKMMRNK